MIRHIVMWRLKDEALGATKAENAERLVAEIEALGGIVPGLRTIDAGVEIAPCAGGWDLALYSEFDSREALAAYQVHPKHVALKELLDLVREDRAAIDYEV